jgi:hypothetical protein
MIYTFRFDDVSVNTDTKKLDQMIQFLRSTLGPNNLRLILACSPVVCDMSGCEATLHRERAFPSIWHTESDHRIFYRMERVGVPVCIDKYRQEGAEVAGHGMVHVDHRLLDRAAQEMSILMSCSLLRCAIFVPPFHKWNRDTEDICKEHTISLVKYDPSWRHLAYHPFDRRNANYYVHTHDFHYQDFCARFSP